MSSINRLKNCPFCGGKTAWCDTHDKNDIHTCHHIVCIGNCKAQFDIAVDDNTSETIDEMKAVALIKFNQRVT